MEHPWSREPDHRRSILFRCDVLIILIGPSRDHKGIVEDWCMKLLFYGDYYYLVLVVRLRAVAESGKQMHETD